MIYSSSGLISIPIVSFVLFDGKAQIFEFSGKVKDKVQYITD